ncbi:MAG TPA: hypothetical protein VKR56_11420 [Candidatus Cybelea sp.]|nr:hypothetical protein [Candidatus Cybelea sp.]
MRRSVSTNLLAIGTALLLLASRAAAEQNTTNAYLIVLGRFDDARASAREALHVTCELGNACETITAVQHLLAAAALGSTTQDRGQVRRITGLFGFVQGALLAHPPRDYTEQQEYDKVEASLRSIIDDDQFEKLTAEGRGWSVDQTVAEAVDI